MGKYYKTEPDASVNLTDVSETLPCFSESDSKKIIELITKMPTGVYKMSKDIPGLVETSSNLGIIESSGERVTLSVSLRSAKNEEKEKLRACVNELCKEFGASVSERGEYPAWEYKKDSHLIDVMRKVYFEEYRKEPEIITIHAGLECGIFSNKICGLDCVSIGPDNFDIHTPEERLSISSTARVWDYLKKVLKEI